MPDFARQASGAPSDDERADLGAGASPGRTRGRYSLGDVLGRGGMAVVSRAADRVTGQEVALKELAVSKSDRHYAESCALFEREYHTLAQLSHPHVVTVLDYDVDESGPFYTMELLDGGDLRGLTPVAWRTACSLAYDVCSALALVHSRRLVHRDITPRNVRTTPEGSAKLIDFGAMVPMGPGGLIVGTPQFVAPEVVNRSSLDARTDLFSLGATLYYALTGRPAYPARDFAQLFDSWEIVPVPPSRIVPEIPAAVDGLVLSLLSVDPATRPRSAFEVMQRLAALPGVERTESAGTSRAYLATPVLVGRDALLSSLNHEMTRACAGRGRGVLVQGRAGLGRSRVLDASALAAKTLGMTVLRASGSAARSESFRAANLLAEQLLCVAPDIALSVASGEDISGILLDGAESVGEAPAAQKLRDFASGAVSRVALQEALGKWFLRFSRERPLAIIVDDIHRIDEASAALLAAIASQADRERIIVLAIAEEGAEPNDRLAFDVLLRNSTRFTLPPLDRFDTERLLTSVFGEVPNLGVLTESVFSIAAGNPREVMDLAQHLIDTGRIHYAVGTWTLPPRLDAKDLPRSAEESIQVRLAALSPLGRWLVEAQAVATHRAFTREDYARVRPSASPREIDRAILELVSNRIVASDGRVYSVAHSGFTSALVAALSPGELAERHRALCDLYEGRLDIGVVRHALFAGLEARALDKLAPTVAETPEASGLYDLVDVTATELAATFERALDAAERLGRPELEVNELRRWLASLSVGADDKYYWRVAPKWLERLKYDSGYAAWEEITDAASPADRISRAMQITYGRYMTTPESVRVYRPDEAIKGLVRYVAISIAIGSSRQDGALLESLPALLEPFAPISELVHVIWQNALATRESMCRIHPERARALWIEVDERLSRITGSDAQYAAMIRYAIAFGVGSNESWMGLESASKRADVLDGDRLQRVNAFYLRRIIRMQQGDWDGAEKFRKQAEVLSLQARSRQMFTTLNSVELNACFMARDITGLKQCADKIRALAPQMPGWVPHLHLAEGRLELLCDGYPEALSAFERALALVTPRADRPYPLHTGWCPAEAGRVEALLGLGRFDDARSAGLRALATAESLEIGFPAFELVRPLALAEARLGDYTSATKRLEEVIDEQRSLGTSGLHLGASYEARARIAIWANDEAAVTKYAGLTAREYRHGQGSPLGARYERLMNDARRVAHDALPGLSDMALSRVSDRFFPRTSATEVVTQAMKGADGTRQRAERALLLLCNARSAEVGYLYLFDRNGVRLAASQGPAAPDGLSSFIEEYVGRELEESEQATGFVDEDSEDVEPARQYIDSRGTTFHPVFLTAVLDGATCYVGVAALALAETPKPLEFGLITALGAHFIQAGDTHPLRP